MSIQSSELVWRRSVEVSDQGSNGGRMSSIVALSGVKNAIFPDVQESERVAGSTKYRKMFILVNNGEDPDADGNEGLALIQPKVFVETQTPGDDMVTIFPGTFIDIQSQISSPQLYGMGLLNAPVSGGATSLVVNVEDWSTATIFVAGMKIRVSDKASISAGSGNEEYHVIDAGGVSVSGNQITLTLATALSNGYAAGSKVSSVYEPADVEASVSNANNTGSGTFDVNEVTVDNTGTVTESVTVTFTSATTFDVEGLHGGNLGSGNVGSDFTATNPDTSGRLFTIQSSAWGGTFTTNDEVTFDTDPAAVPIWYQRDVPNGASSVSGNSVIVAISGESA